MLPLIFGLMKVLKSTLKKVPVKVAGPKVMCSRTSRVRGSTHDDIIKGSDADNWIVAEAGDDLVDTGKGNDMVRGGGVMISS